LSALWEEGHLFSRNIRITLSDLYGAWLVKIDAWFTLEELETVDITPNLSVIFPDGPMALVKWIKSNEAEFKQKVLARALNPFRYTKNLFGVRPNKFLAEVNFIHNMRLAKVAGFYVLVVSVPPGL
jgi:hypothetical protein